MPLADPAKVTVKRIDLRLNESQLAFIDEFRDQCSAREGRHPSLHAAVERLIHGGLIHHGLLLQYSS